MKVIICTWRIREWELQILNWSSSVQPEIVPLFTISFQCLKKKFKSWQVYDWLAKWLIMSGYMDLRRPRVYRRSNVGLVYLVFHKAIMFMKYHKLIYLFLQVREIFSHNGFEGKNIPFVYLFLYFIHINVIYCVLSLCHYVWFII